MIFSKILLMHVLLFQLLLLLQSPSQAETSITEDVQKFTDKFASLAAPSVDWLAHIERITEDTSKFLKMAGPAASIVAAAFDTAFAPQSKEMQAINNLHKQVSEGFNRIEHTLQLLEGRILHHLNIQAYRTEVTRNIDLLKITYAEVTDPNIIIRQEYETEFIRQCRHGTTAPIAILTEIERMTRVSCPTPTRISEQLTSEAAKQFMAIENIYKQRRLSPDELFDYQAAKINFLKKIVLVSKRNAFQWLDNLQKGIGNLLSSPDTPHLSQLTSVISEIESTQQTDECILNTAIVANEQKTSAARLISEMIIADLAKIGFMAGVCSNISFAGNSSKMEHYKEKIQWKIEDISEFISTWITKKLDYQWPLVQMTYALEEIKDEIVQAAKYNATAEMLGKELMKRGLPGYHYHVLISENWNDVKYYYGPICYDSNCNGTTDYKGINIATFRQPIESREMAQLAQKWAEIWHENITAIMKRELHSDSLRSIAQIIDGAIEGILQRSAFHGYVFIRNRAYWQSNCVINFGLFSQSTLSEEVYTKIEYSYNLRITELAQLFNLFLFV